MNLGVNALLLADGASSTMIIANSHFDSFLDHDQSQVEFYNNGDSIMAFINCNFTLLTQQPTHVSWSIHNNTSPPAESPSKELSPQPSKQPSKLPSVRPTDQPSQRKTADTITVPSKASSKFPSDTPSQSPTLTLTSPPRILRVRYIGRWFCVCFLFSSIGSSTSLIGIGTILVDYQSEFEIDCYNMIRCECITLVCLGKCRILCDESVGVYCPKVSSKPGSCPSENNNANVEYIGCDGLENTLSPTQSPAVTSSAQPASTPTDSQCDVSLQECATSNCGDIGETPYCTNKLNVSNTKCILCSLERKIKKSLK